MNLRSSIIVKILPTLAATLAMLGLISTSVNAEDPLPETAFTYQGRLTDGGEPADGLYDFQFRLYTADVDGTQAGPVVTLENQPVSGGLFSVELDFGQLFKGTTLYLETGVRRDNETDAYTILSPRQPLRAVPFALTLPGLYTRQNMTSTNLIGGYSGNDVADGVVGATIGGGGWSGAANYIVLDYGTVSGGRGNIVRGDAATISGGYDNLARGTGATVSGGGRNKADNSEATVAGGLNNTASGVRATVSGGHFNTASALWATVGGGNDNTASGDRATIGGGGGNTASALFTTVGGGGSNVAGGRIATVGGGGSNTASNDKSTIAGGWGNIASGGSATIGGGDLNQAVADLATVGGGRENFAYGDFSTINGGQGNSAHGNWATISGGTQNIANGDYSFAAGNQAQAYKPGCFVWGDSTNAAVSCNNDNRWVARTSGGVYFYTNGNLSSGVYVSPGGGAWNSLSDRAAKENLESVDTQVVLERVAELPLTTWNYKSQDPSIRHMGPMAQDFHAAFGLNDSDRHINSLDADGVALAAIQGLYQQLQAQEAEIAALREQNADLSAYLDALLDQLERNTGQAEVNDAP